ncbi:MAG: molybdopterin-guanine dinucleotide biosynthesis protein B [Nitrospira sp.]|nr:molybdopterin-guanine dinucleotide biosynthesis protein B [Nitrospira sp.]
MEHTSSDPVTVQLLSGSAWLEQVAPVPAGPSSLLLLSRRKEPGYVGAYPVFCRRSNSGKTTLIERVIPLLVRAGYKVATVKHAGHGFDLDTEGKDSWRHKQAGASSVVIISKSSLAMFADVLDHMNVEDVRERYLDASYDLILAEGWRSEGYPRSWSCGTRSEKSCFAGRPLGHRLQQACRDVGALMIR